MLLAAPGLPLLARTVLQELIDLTLLDIGAVKDFLTDFTEQLPGFTTRERTANALVNAKLLTPYQRDRVVACNTAGLVLGAYRVLDRIGGGSSAVIFLGEHVLLRRRVAIKVLPVDDSVSLQVLHRFRTEIQAIASIDHPHVVAAYDAGELTQSGHTTLYYLAMELVSGGDVEHYVYEHGPQPVERACEWARQAAGALQAAHDKHLIHRDLKPSNLLLTADRRVKVVDFGLVRRLSSVLTRTKSLIGTVDFMSPEQTFDPTAVGPESDVYSLGATLFWILTGQLKHPRIQNITEMVRSISSTPPRRLRELLPDIPAALDALVTRMLAREPNERPLAVEVMNELLPFTASVDDSGSAVISMRDTVRQLKVSLRSRDEDIKHSHAGIIRALTRMVESCDGETDGHMRRMQGYVGALAEKLAEHPQWQLLGDARFLTELIRCVPLHDIGKVNVPESLLEKTGELTDEERRVLESHTVAGCEILDSLAREHADSMSFLMIARSIIRHHHERWDGSGIPDKLVGIKIPPAARLVALADSYELLRRVAPGRPDSTHVEAMQAILSTEGCFDPVVLDAFRACEKRFEECFLTTPC